MSSDVNNLQQKSAPSGLHNTTTEMQNHSYIIAAIRQREIKIDAEKASLREKEKNLELNRLKEMMRHEDPEKDFHSDHETMTGLQGLRGMACKRKPNEDEAQAGPSWKRTACEERNSSCQEIITIDDSPSSAESVITISDGEEEGVSKCSQQLRPAQTADGGNEEQQFTPTSKILHPVEKQKRAQQQPYTKRVRFNNDETFHHYHVDPNDIEHTKFSEQNCLPEGVGILRHITSKCCDSLKSTNKKFKTIIRSKIAPRSPLQAGIEARLALIKLVEDMSKLKNQMNQFFAFWEHERREKPKPSKNK